MCTHLACHNEGAKLDHILRDRHAFCSRLLYSCSRRRSAMFPSRLQERSQDDLLALFERRKRRAAVPKQISLRTFHAATLLYVVRRRHWAALGERARCWWEAQPRHMSATRGGFRAIHSFDPLCLQGRITRRTLHGRSWGRTRPW